MKEPYRSYVFFVLPTCFLLGILFAASIVHALTDLAVDFPTYSAPATVNYVDASVGSGYNLYWSGQSLPICYNETDGWGAASGELNTDCGSGSGTGSFDGSLAGDYHLIQIFAAACHTLSYSACVAANGEGFYNVADFTITETGGGGATTTDETALSAQAQQNIFNGFVIFFIFMMFPIWLFRRK